MQEIQAEPPKVVKALDYDKEDESGRFITFNKVLWVDDIVSILKQYETEHGAVMHKCKCSSFGENEIFYHVEDLRKAKDFPDPYVTFAAAFCDEGKRDVKFFVNTTTNSTSLIFRVPKKPMRV